MNRRCIKYLPLYTSYSIQNTGVFCISRCNRFVYLLTTSFPLVNNKKNGEIGTNCERQKWHLYPPDFFPKKIQQVGNMSQCFPFHETKTWSVFHLQKETIYFKLNSNGQFWKVFACKQFFQKAARAQFFLTEGQYGHFFTVRQEGCCFLNWRTGFIILLKLSGREGGGGLCVYPIYLYNFMPFMLA